MVWHLTTLIWRKKTMPLQLESLQYSSWYTSCWSCWQCKTMKTSNCRKPVLRQFSTDLTLQLVVHGHFILFYKKGYLKKCNCIYCSGCCQLDEMLGGKVVWDQLNRSLILHSKSFCKFLSMLLFFSPKGKLKFM